MSTVGSLQAPAGVPWVSSTYFSIICERIPCWGELDAHSTIRCYAIFIEIKSHIWLLRFVSSSNSTHGSVSP